MAAIFSLATRRNTGYEREVLWRTLWRAIGVDVAAKGILKGTGKGKLERTLCFTLSRESGESTEKPIKITCALE